MWNFALFGAIERASEREKYLTKDDIYEWMDGLNALECVFD